MVSNIFKQCSNGFRGFVHAIEIAITGSAHHLVADDIHFRAWFQIGGRVVVGHDASILNGIEHIEKAIQIGVVVQTVAVVPFGLEVDKQEVARCHHLLLVEHENRLHVGRGFIGFRTQRLIILVDREVEGRIKRFVLPRLGELELILELTRARHLPTHQRDGHQKHEHLRCTVVTMPYPIEKIFYLTHNQIFKNLIQTQIRVLN